MKHKSHVFCYFLIVFFCFFAFFCTIFACNYALFGGKSSDYHTFLIPDLVGSEWDAAALPDAFSYTLTYACDPNIPAGRVIAQSPAANTERTTRAGSPIRLRLTVSLGKQTVQMPDLVGSDMRQARESLQALGLCVTCRPQFAPDQRDFTVLLQSIPAQRELSLGSEVTLVYASPLPQHSATVPSLAGLSSAKANLALLQAGLLHGKITITDTNTDSDADADLMTVSTQQIPAGTLVPLGTPIDYTLTRTETLWNFPIAEESSRALADFTRFG